MYTGTESILQWYERFCIVWYLVDYSSTRLLFFSTTVGWSKLHKIKCNHIRFKIITCYMNSIIRSPQLAEVLIAYGGVHVLSIHHLLNFEGTFSEYCLGLVVGGCAYTFIEYWFHRYLLHLGVLKDAHDNHHKNPIKLKIIATPLLPVQIYETLIMIAISAMTSSRTANLFQIGISISQIIMDFVHYLQHSSYNGWWLISAKSYHKLHHGKDNHYTGYGLTCPFWDAVFSTSPIDDDKHYKQWSGYHNNKWLYWTQIPLPMVNFIAWTPWVKKENPGHDLPIPDLTSFKFSKMMIAGISAFIVGYSPFILEFIDRHL